MNILLAPIVVTAIAVVLSLSIFLVEKYFADYGECELSINEEKVLKVNGGRSLLSTLAEEKIFIPSACGGKGSCGYCKVTVSDGAGPLLATELPYLDSAERKENVRLSCQIKVKRDLKMKISDSILNVKDYLGVVSEIKDIASKMKLIEVSFNDDINFKPGQYMQIEAPKYVCSVKKNREIVHRAYSIASSPHKKNRMQFIITHVPDGICSTYVHYVLKKGDNIKITGPYGDFYLKESSTKDMVMIATGSGLAPIKSIVEFIKKEGLKRNIQFFYGGRSKQELAFHEYLEDLSLEMQNFDYLPTLSQENSSEWTYDKGRVTSSCNKYLSDISNKEFYLCGNPAMIDSVVEILKDKGVLENDIMYDSFG